MGEGFKPSMRRDLGERVDEPLMSAALCTYCKKPISSPPVRRHFKEFCSPEHRDKYVERERRWRGLDQGNVGGRGCC